jgi:hypothetical protein
MAPPVPVCPPLIIDLTTTADDGNKDVRRIERYQPQEDRAGGNDKGCELEFSASSR